MFRQVVDSFILKILELRTAIDLISFVLRQPNYLGAFKVRYQKAGSRGILSSIWDVCGIRNNQRDKGTIIIVYWRSLVWKLFFSGTVIDCENSSITISHLYYESQVSVKQFIEHVLYWNKKKILTSPNGGTGLYGNNPVLEHVHVFFCPRKAEAICYYQSSLVLWQWFTLINI